MKKRPLEFVLCLAPFLPFSHAIALTNSTSASAAAAHAGSPADSDPVLVGAGDIADCTDLAGAEATAALLEKIPGTVFAAGDLAFPDSTKENFACYDKTWAA